MRGSGWRVTAVLLALLTSGSTSPQQQHKQVSPTSHKPSNPISRNNSGQPAAVTVRPHVVNDTPERWRRSPTSLREQRAASTAALLNKLQPMHFAPVRGRRASWQALKEMSAEENPFWAARGRRSTLESETPFWAARGKKPSSIGTKTLTLLGSGEDNPFWAARGKKFQELLESAEVDNPFWAARGKKFKEFLESGENPFWAARGKKCTEKDYPNDANFIETDESPFWATRGKKLSNFVNSGENPFWAARGKKLESGENPFWAARGKKLESGENPFWAARGKKLESGENPFWAARGKKLESGENPFWAARGKKLESGENPFWAARGKKSSELVESAENPFWAARGKKMLESAETPFYAPRGKKGSFKDVSKENPSWASRGRRGSMYSFLNQDDTNKRTGSLAIVKPRANRESGSNLDTFWPVRGKKNMENLFQNGYFDDAEFNKEDELFWKKLENKTALLGGKRNNNEEAINLQDVLSQIFGIPNERKPKKKNHKELILNPNYSTSFWSSRG